jgi:steroid 5-alpha reductase family enzyme
LPPGLGRPAPRRHDRNWGRAGHLAPGQRGGGARPDTGPGLWRYTRHPNYFGDACVWWGLFLVSIGSAAGLATVFSPLLMTVLLAAGSGKPLTESRMRERPGHADYVRRTSGFFPLPPRP